MGNDMNGEFMILVCSFTIFRHVDESSVEAPGGPGRRSRHPNLRPSGLVSGVNVVCVTATGRIPKLKICLMLVPASWAT